MHEQVTTLLLLPCQIDDSTNRLRQIWEKILGVYAIII
jgi:hypothetical protein